MAIDPQNRKKVDETATYVQDTLLSVSAKIGEVLKDAVNEAFDGAEASVIKTIGNDLTRSFKAAAKFSDTLANNTFKISQGLMSSNDVEKQMLDLSMKRSALARKIMLARAQGVELNLEDISATKEALDVQKEALEKDIERTKNIEKNMGSMGELFTRLSKNKFFGSILNAEKGLIAMRKAADKNVTGFKLLGTGIKAAFEGIEKATVILFLINQAVKVFRFFKDLAFGVSEQTKNIALSLGTSMEVARGVRNEFQDMITRSGDIVFNLERMEKALADVNRTFGYARRISQELLQTQVRLTHRVGASAEAAATFNMLVAATGDSANYAYERIVNLGIAMQQVDGIGVDTKTVVEDIAAAGAETASYFGYSTDALAAAVIEARKLGLNITQAKTVAKGLLDFENSISAQLELSVLTQKQFNFGNAMAKAAMGDIAGATKDVIRQMNQLTAEQRKSPIILEAMSRATGLSTEELAKQYALQYDINAQKEEYGRILAKEGKTKALQFLTDKGIALAEVEEINNRVSASEKFNEVLTRLKDQLSRLVSGGLVDRLMTIIEKGVLFLEDKLGITSADKAKALITNLSTYGTAEEKKFAEATLKAEQELQKEKARIDEFSQLAMEGMKYSKSDGAINEANRQYLELQAKQEKFYKETLDKYDEMIKATRERNTIKMNSNDVGSALNASKTGLRPNVSSRGV